MSSLNKCMIIGNLGADPEVRYTNSNTAVANFSLATQERYKDKNGEWQEETEWHRVVAWGRKAEIAQEYLKKGSKVYIEGKIQTRKWEDKNGQERYTTEINAFVLTMLDGKPEGDRPSQPRSQPKKKQPVVDLDDDFDDMDDDLPF